MLLVILTEAERRDSQHRLTVVIIIPVQTRTFLNQALPYFMVSTPTPTFFFWGVVSFGLVRDFLWLLQEVNLSGNN